NRRRTRQGASAYSASSARTQSGTHRYCDHQTRSWPEQSLDPATCLTTAPFFSICQPACGREAIEMLFKTQMGFVGKAIRIRIKSSLEVLDLAPGIAPEGGAR